MNEQLEALLALASARKMQGNQSERDSLSRIIATNLGRAASQMPRPKPRTFGDVPEDAGLFDAENALLDSLAAEYYYPRDAVVLADLPYGTTGKFSGGKIRLNPEHDFRRMGGAGAYDPTVQFNEGEPRTLAHEVVHSLASTSEQSADQGARILLDMILGGPDPDGALAGVLRKSLEGVKQQSLEEGTAARRALRVLVGRNRSTIRDIDSQIEPARAVSTYVSR